MEQTAPKGRRLTPAEMRVLLADIRRTMNDPLVALTAPGVIHPEA